MKKFPSFWYDSTAFFGRINNIADLKKVILYTTNKQHGLFENKDDFLDVSVQSRYNEFISFGTRIEHDTEKTLRQYLTENDINIDLL
jgi:AAA+ superfamily predicted ATPase